MQNQCSPRKFSFGIKKTLHYPYKVRWHLGNPFWITLKNHQTSTSLLWMLQSIYNYYVNHKVVSSYDKSYRFTCLKDCHPLLALATNNDSMSTVTQTKKGKICIVWAQVVWKNTACSDASEPTFWRAEPSFQTFKNEPKWAEYFFAKWPIFVIKIFCINSILENTFWIMLFTGVGLEQGLKFNSNL